jgi:TetR/AcrR family transcriptional repressor of nem operon
MAKTSRSEIVAAARDLMRDKGYAGASMKDVAEQVGLLKGSLYSHFASKEELVPEVLNLTFDEIFSEMEPSGNWRADYEAALDRLISMLTAHRRCIGFHLAYGLDETSPVLQMAVATFFLDIRVFFRDLILQGVDITLAEPLALHTITAVEGATLWLALYGNAGPIQDARSSLLARADSLAAEEPDERVRQLLDRMVGDWRRASLAEKRLATRAIEAEDHLLDVQAK